MNGAHDLGGMHGFGPVVLEPDEPVFHAEWERRTFALTLAMGGWRRWNLDMSRHAREQMPPAEYLATSYYEHWLWGLERLVERHGFLTRAEIDRRVRQGVAARSRAPSSPSRGRSGARTSLGSCGTAARRGSTIPCPRSSRTGDAVLARNVNPAGHTRIPRYVRGRRGVIDRDHGVFIFPDTHAAGTRPEAAARLQRAVRRRELWGPDGHARDAVYVDLWDDYLDPA